MQKTTTLTSPESEADLLQRASMMAGRRLADIAKECGQTVPENLRREKGWVGQLLEQQLGASAGNLAEPDFPHLGVELKTLPVDAQGKPRESTYVCTAPLQTLIEQTWFNSTVRKKLARVLWVPVEAEPEIPLADRRVGNVLLWSPDSAQEMALQSDWEELVEFISLGQVESVTAHHGACLQLRPKGPHSRVRCRGVGVLGEKIATMPRGFYLRATFTAAILQQNYVLSV